MPEPNKVKRFFVLGGKRAHRLAEIAGNRLVPGDKVDTPRSFLVKRFCKEGAVPDDGLVVQWLRWLQDNGVKEGDIIVLDPFCAATYVEGGVGLASPHMEDPQIPPPEENTCITGSIKNVGFLARKLMIRVVMIVLAPHPHYVMGPCCDLHMPYWHKDVDPIINLDKVQVVDRFIKIEISKYLNV